MPLSLETQRRKQLVQLLVEAREAAGLTQGQLAKSIGKHQPFVSRYESGQRQLDVAEFLEIADALQLDAVTVIRRLAKSTS